MGFMKQHALIMKDQKSQMTKAALNWERKLKKKPSNTNQVEITADSIIVFSQIKELCHFSCIMHELIKVSEFALSQRNQQDTWQVIGSSDG